MSSPFGLAAVVGRLVVAPRSSREPLSSADHRLLADIAHQTGALAHAVRLTMALQRSRERGCWPARRSVAASAATCTTGWARRWPAPEPLPPLPAAVEVAAYRLGHEAITNVVRHADATRCTVTLEATATRVCVDITDDGIGLAQSARPGVGLASMRERTEELGGVFTVSAAQPAGTRIHATLPIATSTTTPGSNGAPSAHPSIGARHG